ncbi:carbon-nitrogen hydrolase family protein [Paenarthrobacter sp. DKR-5]|uniref:carbon-nitrogen hydrolase family protein n=1 Tax=Paenarthrobacter sp. DKR-5 TaxID=2835535 RepID=UPI001BDD3BCB|nr:carbon-nitrogen hydrolase family protein [Paenarthrobacter sp. DKR-5]MBT1004225.1 carbon-nitrogen hydrolase family protein [Paenarthrobacter sp. DKR-5]
MRVALAQIVTGRDPEANLRLLDEHAGRAKEAGAELVVFPEASMRAFGNSLTDIAESLDGRWAQGLRDVAARHGIAVVAGMFTPAAGGKVRNTLLATGSGIEAHYDKIHLYDAFGFSESDTVEAGDAVSTFTLGGVTFGLATCYDVRFPALFTANARAGAHINILCASWGAGPGKTDQWDLLVRARALDSTTFVLACGQADPAAAGIETRGTAPTGIGHSAVVGPDGTVLARLDGAPGLLVADVDPGAVEQVRKTLPVLANARL